MEFGTLKKDNRKKWIIGVIAILAIASSIFFVSTRANYKKEQRLNLINATVNYNPSDLDSVAIKVQNTSGGYDSTNTVPTSGYTLSSDSYCEVNGTKDTTVSMEYKDGKVSVGITRQGTKCYLYFDTKKTAAQTLIAKKEMVHETFTNDSGELIDTGYRYEGANPNNYVRFNNELWRIIGVFDVEITAGKTESLVKLIRNANMGIVLWNTDASNDWTQSDIKTILNGQYYSGEDINYKYKDTSYGTVSITGVSIKDTVREMIENIKWNIGGASTANQTASSFYTEERGTRGSGTNPSVTIWNGYIGLIYPSDFGYAVDSVNCPRTTNLISYSSSCKTSNWLYGGYNSTYWTLTSNSNSSGSVFFANDLVNAYGASSTFNARPSLYLKSNVSIVDNGNDGSIDRPYDLTM